jgi:hypothetical protein
MDRRVRLVLDLGTNSWTRHSYLARVRPIRAFVSHKALWVNSYMYCYRVYVFVLGEVRFSEKNRNLGRAEGRNKFHPERQQAEGAEMRARGTK